MKGKRKLRGGNRIIRKIKYWESYSLNLDLKLLKENHREYVKIWVSPFSHLHLKRYAYPEPSRLHKRLIMNALLNIYDTWKQQLDDLGEPYYLKIWLFENHFKYSQVVCSVQDKLHFYNNAFTKSDDLESANKFVKINPKIEEYKWELYFDENFDENENYVDKENVWLGSK
jgi:hypothetical protein